MNLTPVEKIAFLGIGARDREFRRAAVELEADNTALLRSIEERLGLDTGAIGTTHDVDLGRAVVVERPPTDPTP